MKLVKTKQLTGKPFNINNPIKIYRPEISKKCSILLNNLFEFKKQGKVTDLNVLNLAEKLRRIDKEERAKKDSFKQMQKQHHEETEQFFILKQKIWATLKPQLQPKVPEDYETQQKLLKTHRRSKIRSK